MIELIEMVEKHNAFITINHSEGPAGRTTSNRPCSTWPDGPSTTLLAETEVSSRGELDLENVEGGDTYLGVGRLHLRDIIRLLHDRPTVT